MSLSQLGTLLAPRIALVAVLSKILNMIVKDSTSFVYGEHYILNTL